MVIPFKENTFSVMDSMIIDPLFSEFGKIYERNLKKFQGDYKDNQFTARCWKLLKGRYKKQGVGDYLIVKGHDGEDVSVPFAQISSGQQGLFPALISLSSSFGQSNNFVFYEEPEAHIFPSTQKELVELLSMLRNSGDNNKLIITTHSPYILTALNNLIQAKNVVNLHPELEEEVNTIIPREYWVDYEDVAVYQVKNPADLKEGESSVELLMNEETKLIYADLIDEVSEQLDVDFDKLLDLKYD